MNHNLPIGWVWRRLGEVCERAEYGHTTSAKQDGNGPLFLRTTDISNGEIHWHSVPFCAEPPSDEERYSLKDGDILVARAGSVGASIVIRNPPRSVFASYLIRFRPKEELNPLYAGFFMKSNMYWTQLGSKTAGTTLPGVNATNLSKVQIPLPPLPTQRRIVSLLEKAEETKRLRAQADELMERLLQSVFLEMFGDPVKNPKGWERRKLSAVSHINMGQSPPGESYNKNRMGTPLLNGPTEFGDIHPTTAQWTDKPTKICNIGDILFCVRGATAGRMNWADQRYCIGRGIAAIQPISNLSDNRYLYQILFMNYERFQATGKGSTFINISSSELGNLIVPLPPLPLQQKFARVVEKVESMRQSQAQSKQQVEDLFSALMQKAFRGEL